MQTSENGKYATRWHSIRTNQSTGLIITQSRKDAKISIWPRFDISGGRGSISGGRSSCRAANALSPKDNRAAGPQFDTGQSFPTARFWAVGYTLAAPQERRPPVDASA